MALAGYSGTPLARKLGIKEGHRLAILNAPDDFLTQLDLPMGVQTTDSLGRVTLDMVLLFVRLRRELEAGFPRAAKRLTPEGALWVVWPKLTARKRLGIVSDITEDTVREVAFPNGFVDVKVCAVDEVWSGLRCVLRLENRPKAKSGR